MKNKLESIDKLAIIALLFFSIVGIGLYYNKTNEIKELKNENNRIVQYMVELEKENQILGSCCANGGNLNE